MKGAARTVKTSDLLRVLATAPNVSAAARELGCARTAIYKRAQREQRVREALDQLQARRHGAPSVEVGPDRASRDAVRTEVEDRAEPVEGLPGAKVPQLPPKVEQTDYDSELQMAFRAMLAEQIQIARAQIKTADGKPISVSPAIRMKAADSAMRWAIARLALNRVTSSSSTVAEPIMVEATARKTDRPLSTREVAKLIRFRKGS